jgi:hypothetical protein
MATNTKSSRGERVANRVGKGSGIAAERQVVSEKQSSPDQRVHCDNREKSKAEAPKGATLSHTPPAADLVELIRQANAIAELELDGETEPPTRCVMINRELWRRILKAADITDKIGDDWHDEVVWVPTDEAFQGVNGNG